MVGKICSYVIYEAEDVLNQGYSIPDPEEFFWDAQVCDQNKDPLIVDDVDDWESRGGFPDIPMEEWSGIDLGRRRGTVLKLDLLRVAHEYSIIKRECVDEPEYCPTSGYHGYGDDEEYCGDDLYKAFRSIVNIARWNCQISNYFSDSTQMCQKVTLLSVPESEDRYITF